MKFNFCPTCKSDLALGKENYIACINEECSFVHYENPTPVVAAVIEYKDGNVLLAHNAAWPPKIFALVTGFLEKHEHPEIAVLREVKEEVGLDAEIRGFLGHYSFRKINKVKTWDAGTGYALKKFLESKGYTPEVISFK
jgi:NAD+ diphosphatase